MCILVYGSILADNCALTRVVDDLRGVSIGMGVMGGFIVGMSFLLVFAIWLRRSNCLICFALTMLLVLAIEIIIAVFLQKHLTQSAYLDNSSKYLEGWTTLCIQIEEQGNRGDCKDAAKWMRDIFGKYQCCGWDDPSDETQNPPVSC
jgi:hypothetical protein